MYGATDADAQALPVKNATAGYAFAARRYAAAGAARRLVVQGKQGGPQPEAEAAAAVMAFLAGL